MKLTKELAEVIGIHVGDGSLYKTNTGMAWEIRGDLKERSYYENHLCHLLKDIFGIEITSKYRSGGKNGVWGVRICNPDVINVLLEYSFVPGTKTYTVSVPDYIFKSNLDIKRAFIRGLFDSDGCLNFMAINGKNEKNYPRIRFTFASKKLRDSLKLLLKDVGFVSYSWDYMKEYSLCLAGKKKLSKWERDINPKNPKFLKKLNDWKNVMD